MASEAIEAPVVLSALKVVYCPRCGLPPELCEFNVDYEKCRPWIQEHFPELLVDVKTDDGRQQMSKLSVKQKLESDNEESDEDEDEEKDSSKKSQRRLASVQPATGSKGGKAVKAPTDVDNKRKWGKRNLKEENHGQDPDEPPENPDEEQEKPKKAIGFKKNLEEPPAAAPLVQEVLIKLQSRGSKKHVTVLAGLESFGIALNKDTTAKFSKKFACSAAIVKGIQGPEIHIQGDVTSDVASFLVKSFPMVLKDRVFSVDSKARKTQAYFNESEESEEDEDEDEEEEKDEDHRKPTPKGRPAAKPASLSSKANPDPTESRSGRGGGRGGLQPSRNMGAGVTGSFGDRGGMPGGCGAGRGDRGSSAAAPPRGRAGRQDTYQPGRPDSGGAGRGAASASGGSGVGRGAGSGKSSAPKTEEDESTRMRGIEDDFMG